MAPDTGRELELHRLVDRFRVVDKLVVVGERQRLDVREEALGVGWRMVAEYPGQGQLDGLAVRQQGAEHAAGKHGRPGLVDRDIGGERVALKPVMPRGVGKIDLYPVLRRRLVAELTQPG